MFGRNIFEHNNPDDRACAIECKGNSGGIGLILGNCQCVE